VGDTGLEPVTPSLSSKGASNVSVDTKALTTTPSGACTTACTGEPENGNAGTQDADYRSEGEGFDATAACQGDPLAKLAAELGNLSEDDRARLVAMLTGGRDEREGPA